MTRCRLFLLMVVLMPLHLTAQEAEWEVEGEVGGSVFFGNQSQTVLATSGLVERTDPLFESTSEAHFSYGRSMDDEGESFVNRRSWDATTDLTFRPELRWSPFVSGRIQSSLERRIALRYNTGAGMKLVLRRDDRTRVELSAAVLAERTFPRDDADAGDEDTLARWSNRLRIRREAANGRIEFSSETSYRPAFAELGDFTLTSRNILSFELTDQVRLRLTFVDEYDAGAVERGAQTNNDGRIQVTIVAQL